MTAVHRIAIAQMGCFSFGSPDALSFRARV
jgi:hypothetical protein